MARKQLAVLKTRNGECLSSRQAYQDLHIHKPQNCFPAEHQVAEPIVNRVPASELGCKEIINLNAVTVYNPDKAQTDDTPCLAGGVDICKKYNNGTRILALSQDLCGWAGCGSANYPKGSIQKGQKVRLISDDLFVDGEYEVQDAMNERFTKKADMYHPTISTGRWDGVKLCIL